jgi:phage FluMu protein Com
MATSLETRVERLEAAYGGDEGCPRCVGTLIIVGDATTDKLHSAKWNGKEISEEELREHETETKCPRCGRKIDPDERAEIKVGGRRFRG